ncbi:MAG: DoxX family protein [uncultured bacterium]|nr:MAG: DoxX family protein [uncultured bacterium]
METTKERYLWAILRIVMGWFFLWPFFDKLFGLGFSTCLDKTTKVVTYGCKSAWINGGLVTKGFLGGSTGVFAEFYKGIAGQPAVEWLFMIGLLCIGLALLAGIGVKIAGYSGALMVLLMWSVNIPPSSNPIIDAHILEALVFIGFTFVKPGHLWGLGKWWSETALVKKYGFLE